MSDTSGVLAGRRVLVLEDEYLVAEEMAQLLTCAGATVVGPFGSVEGALQALAGEPELDLAILDVNVHGDRSYPVAEVLQARGVPVLFVTGCDSPLMDAAWATTPRCLKPFNKRQLLESLPL